MIYHGIFGAELKYEPAGLEYVPAENRDSRLGSVIIFPGGGYNFLSAREETPVIKAFNRHGYRAFSLAYDCQSEVLGLRPLKQAAWAIARVRLLFPDEPVFLCGFSAGAHCAASCAIHHDDMDWNGLPLFNDIYEFLAKDRYYKSFDSTFLFRPDGMILSYPVVTGGGKAHVGSFIRLLGNRSDFEKRVLSDRDVSSRYGNGFIYDDLSEYYRALKWFSLETQVHKSTPQTFIWHTANDNEVPVQNSLLLVNALIEAGVPVEYHLYPYGTHGLSLATRETEEIKKDRYADPHVANWFERAIDWMEYIIKVPRT